MTIDERLDRLTARHEALTQTVELIAAAQIKSDEEIDKLTARMAETDRFIARLAPPPAPCPPRAPALASHLQGPVIIALLMTVLDINEIREILPHRYRSCWSTALSSWRVTASSASRTSRPTSPSSRATFPIFR